MMLMEVIDLSQVASLLERLKDTRKLLVDRLPLAWDLLQGRDFIFPGQKQYLLDWFLDASYRLFKANDERIREALSQRLYWKLFYELTVAPEGENSVLGSKRPYPLPRFFTRPILPIFSIFFKHFTSPCDIDEYVCLVLEKIISVDIITLEYIMRKIPPKSIKEFIAHIKFPRQQATILLKWLHYSGNDEKFCLEIVEEGVTLFRALNDDDLSSQILCNILLSKSIIQKMLNESAHGTLEVLKRVGLVNFFQGIVKIDLNQSELRKLQIISLTFLSKEANFEEEFPQILATMKTSGFASTQNDEAWLQTKALIEKWWDNTPNRPEVIQAIAEFELELVQPNLSTAISSLPLDDSLMALLKSLCKGHATTRQLERFIPLLIEFTSGVLPLSFWQKSVRPNLQPLHQRAIRGIVQATIPVVKTPLGARNMLNLLQSLICLDAKLVKEMLPEAKKWLQSLPDCHGEFLALIETLTDYYPEILETELDVNSELSDGLIVQMYLRGHRPDLNPSQISWETFQKYLPVLVSKICPSTWKTFDPALLESSLFWEVIPDVNQLVQANINDIDFLEVIIKNKPRTLYLDSQVAAQCLERLPHLTEKIVTDGQELPVPVNLSSVTSVSDKGLVLLSRKRAISVDLLLNRLKANPMMANATSLLLESLEAMNDQQCKDLAEFLLKDRPGIFDSSKIRLLAVLGTRISDLPDQTVKALPLTPRILIDIHFAEFGNVNVKIDFRHFIDQYTRGDLKIDPRLIVKFISNFEDLRTTLEHQRANCALLDEQYRLWEVLDVLLIQNLEIQNITCPIVDDIIFSPSFEIAQEHVSLIVKLLHHRLLCGGTNIASLQVDSTFEALLRLVATLLKKYLIKEIVEGLCAILSTIMKFHWQKLHSCRPLFVAFLQSLLLKAPLMAPRKIARVLGDFASHRQVDQHYYVGPLILTFVHQSMDITTRNILIPAMCGLVRHLDQHRSHPRDESINAKYFNADPLERLMRQAETEDAQTLLRELFKTYEEGYKFTGKA